MWDFMILIHLSQILYIIEIDALDSDLIQPELSLNCQPVMEK
jgi:hypothetical protein